MDSEQHTATDHERQGTLAWLRERVTAENAARFFDPELYSESSLSIDIECKSDLADWNAKIAATASNRLETELGRETHCSGATRTEKEDRVAHLQRLIQDCRTNHRRLRATVWALRGVRFVRRLQATVGRRQRRNHSLEELMSDVPDDFDISDAESDAGDSIDVDSVAPGSAGDGSRKSGTSHQDTD
jgi:hypothetical protein